VNTPSIRHPGRVLLLLAVCAALLPLRALALGGDPNLLIKSKAPPAGEGYVLYSFEFSKADFNPFERPCLGAEMVPVLPAEVATKKKPKSQNLSTTTGLHCNTAWSSEAAVVQEGDLMRVVVLRSVPPGEYEIHEGSAQYSVAMMTYKADPTVTGFGRVQVTAGKMAYAGTFRLLTNSRSAALRAADAWQKDAEVLHRLRPDLASMEVVQATWSLAALP
jgi:hypothetical protein